VALPYQALAPAQGQVQEQALALPYRALAPAQEQAQLVRSWARAQAQAQAQAQGRAQRHWIGEQGLAQGQAQCFPSPVQAIPFPAQERAQGRASVMARAGVAHPPVAELGSRRQAESRVVELLLVHAAEPSRSLSPAG